MEFNWKLLAILACIILILTIVIFTIILILYRNSMNKTITTTEEVITRITGSVPTLNGLDRVQYTEKLLQFIDNAITMELINARRFELILGKKNKNLDVEKVLEEIATKVFESIRPDIYDDPNSIVTGKYLMEYIQKRTTISYMTYLNETNTGIGE